MKTTQKEPPLKKRIGFSNFFAVLKNAGFEKEDVLSITVSLKILMIFRSEHGFYKVVRRRKKTRKNSLSSGRLRF
jgi:hypothetical protein